MFSFIPIYNEKGQILISLIWNELKCQWIFIVGCFWSYQISKMLEHMEKCLIMNVILEFYFFQDSTQHVPSETSEDPEVEVTIEG